MGSRKGTDDPIEWADLLSDMGPKGKPPPGEGWKTMSQLHTEMGFGICKSRRIIKQMMLDGKIESFVGSSPSVAIGDLCRQVWYRPISKKG